LRGGVPDRTDDDDDDDLCYCDPFALDLPTSDVVTIVSRYDKQQLQAVQEKSKNRPRSTNFDFLQDLVLCKAYLITSTVLSKGAGLKGDRFYIAVGLNFRDIDRKVGLKSDKHWRSLRGRWIDQIKKDMLKFNKYYAKIADPPPTGTMKNDWLEQAAKDFHAATGKAFRFMQCVETIHQIPGYGPLDVVEYREETKADNMAKSRATIPIRVIKYQSPPIPTDANCKDTDLSSLSSCSSAETRPGRSNRFDRSKK
jgi:hypothetical protein